MIRSFARRAGLPAGPPGISPPAARRPTTRRSICALTRAEPRFASEGVARVRGPGGDVHLPRVPARLAQDRASCRHRARGAEADRYRRQRPHGRTGARRSGPRRTMPGAVPVLISATAGTTERRHGRPAEHCAPWRAKTTSGITSMPPGAGRHSAPGGCDACWPESSAPTRSPSTPTSGSRRPWAAACSSPASRRWSARRFASAAKFMPSSAAGIDPYLNSVQWSRRFMGLRLFLSLAAAGWEGYAAHVERAAQVIERVRERLAARGWSVANDSALAVLCVLPPAGSSRFGGSCTGARVRPRLGCGREPRGAGGGENLRDPRRDFRERRR